MRLRLTCHLLSCGPACALHRRDPASAGPQGRAVPARALQLAACARLVACADITGCAQHLQEQLRLADSQREAELKRQAQYMAVASAEAAVGERMKHSEALDQVGNLHMESVHMCG